MIQRTARPRTGRLTQQEVDAGYHKGPSFADHLPWVEFLPDSKSLLLDDGRSVAAVYDIRPVGTEGRSQQYLAEIRDTVKDTLQDSFEETDTHPWVVQFFCQNEDDLSSYLQQLRNYVTPAARGSVFTEAWLSVMEQHLGGISKPGGLFFDDVVTQTPWRGQVRRIRMVIYRHVPARPLRTDESPELALNDVCERVVAALSGAGLQMVRQNKTDIQRWLVRWFNPAPQADDYQAFYDAVTQSDEDETDAQSRRYWQILLNPCCSVSRSRMW